MEQQALHARGVMVTYNSLRLPPDVPFLFDPPQRRGAQHLLEIDTAFRGAFQTADWQLKHWGAPQGSTTSLPSSHDVYAQAAASSDCPQLFQLLGNSAIDWDDTPCARSYSRQLGLGVFEDLWRPQYLTHTASGHDERLGFGFADPDAATSNWNDQYLAPVHPTPPTTDAPCAGTINVARDVARFMTAVLGQRRSYLYAPALASRVFNVALPAGLLTDPGGRGFLVLPVVTLLASPRRRQMRRTLTVAQYYFPVALVEDAELGCGRLVERDVPAREVASLTATWDWSAARARRHTQERPVTNYKLQGDLDGYVRASGKPEGLPDCSFRALTEVLLETVAGRLTGRADGEGHTGRIRDELLRSVSLSKTSLVFSVNADGREADAPDDARAARLAHYLTFADDAVAAPQASRLPPPLIPEGLALDCYYVPPHGTLIYHLDSGRTTGSQRRHHLWNVGYVTYYMLSLSAIRESVFCLHREAEVARGQAIAYQAADALAEIEEIFDLDLAVRPQKLFYQDLLAADRVAREIVQLREKVQGLSQEAQLEINAAEKKGIQNLTLIGALFTVFSAAAAALPDKIPWDVTIFGIRPTRAEILGLGLLALLGVLAWVLRRGRQP